MTKPIIIAICGASSAGKDTWTKYLHEHLEGSGMLVSTTTRPPRVGEVNGRNYNYISKKDFLFLLDMNWFLEYSKYKDWYYGTPWDQIWKQEKIDGKMVSLPREEVLIGVFNPEGLLALLSRKDLVVLPILLEQPWYVRLYRSIKREGKFQKEYIRRLKADHKDFKKYKPLIIQRLHDNGDGICLAFDRQNLKDSEWCVRQVKNALECIKNGCKVKICNTSSWQR